MSPLRIGSHGDELFAVLHEGAEHAPLAMLLCNPFGQEAVRAHRALRVIAERLARAGVPTLRFDYFGTGDSAGMDEQVTLARCTRDIVAADRALRLRTGCSRIGWLGLRLGATLAMLASKHALSAPDRLIAWDPVFDGTAYLSELGRAHREGMARAFPLPPPAFQSAAGNDEEAMGYPIPAVLRDELAQIDRRSFDGSTCRLLAWILPDGIEPPALASVDARTVRVAHVDWATDEALNTSIAPGDVVRAVIDLANAA